MSKKILYLYNSAKIIKIDRVLPNLHKCTATFLWFTITIIIIIIIIIEREK